MSDRQKLGLIVYKSSFFQIEIRRQCFWSGKKDETGFRIKKPGAGGKPQLGKPRKNRKTQLAAINGPAVVPVS